MTIEKIIEGAEYAFNELPNKRLSGGGFKNTYEIASAIGKYKELSGIGEPPSYILCYTLRSTNDRGQRDKDYWEIFCEYDEMENTPEDQAQNKLNELNAQYENDEHTELYTWNIAKIVKTNEHYTVGY
jgi:hypothetical protein